MPQTSRNTPAQPCGSQPRNWSQTRMDAGVSSRPSSSVGVVGTASQAEGRGFEPHRPPAVSCVAGGYAATQTRVIRNVVTLTAVMTKARALQLRRNLSPRRGPLNREPRGDRCGDSSPEQAVCDCCRHFALLRIPRVRSACGVRLGARRVDGVVRGCRHCRRPLIAPPGLVDPPLGLDCRRGLGVQALLSLLALPLTDFVPGHAVEEAVVVAEPEVAGRKPPLDGATNSGAPAPSVAAWEPPALVSGKRRDGPGESTSRGRVYRWPPHRVTFMW